MTVGRGSGFFGGDLSLGLRKSKNAFTCVILLAVGGRIALDGEIALFDDTYLDLDADTLIEFNYQSNQTNGW